LAELGENKVLMTFCIAYLLTIMIYCIAGIYITRYINALARAVCGVSKIVIVWLVGIVVTSTIG
jgi:hypothetical protein